MHQAQFDKRIGLIGYSPRKIAKCILRPINIILCKRTLGALGQSVKLYSQGRTLKVRIHFYFFMGILTWLGPGMKNCVADASILAKNGPLKLWHQLYNCSRTRIALNGNVGTGVLTFPNRHGVLAAQQVPADQAVALILGQPVTTGEVVLALGVVLISHHYL